jgi:hypothetical protein
MRPLFAAKFRVDDNVFEDTVGLVQDWVEDYYRREAGDESPSLCAFSGEPSEDELVECSEDWSPSSDKHRVKTAHKATTYGKLYELKWEQPPDTDAPEVSRILRVAILSGQEGRIIFEVNAALDLQSFRVEPLESGVTRRPDIIPRLVKRFDCKVGDTLVYSYPQKIGEGDALSFIRDDLTDRDRRVPAVLLSHCSDTETPTRDPDWVQNRLLGLANVYEITGPASQVLSEHLGPARSCEKGEARIYWPGFTRRAVPGRHPRFSREAIESNRKEGKMLEALLLETVAEVAADRYSRSPELRSLRRRFRRDRREEMLQQAEELPDEWVDDYDQLERENDRLREKAERLEKRLEQAQENLQAVGRHGSPQRLQKEDSKRKGDVATPAEALQLAEEWYGEYVYVWKSARQAAKNAQYHKPEEIVEALKAVSDLAEKYDRQDGDVGRWKDHFQERGIDFSYQESESTMNQYGDEREFHDGEEKQTMESHITIGQNHDHCLQIFFDKPEGDGARFRVGYCGEHLSIPSYGT